MEGDVNSLFESDQQAQRLSWACWILKIDVWVDQLAHVYDLQLLKMYL